jgi:hypothetical protein
MPTAEARYVRMVGDYIIEILPESTRLRDAVLAYVTRKITVTPWVRQIAVAAAIAVASCTMTVVASDMLEAQTTLAARIVQNEHGGISLVVVRESQDGATVVLYREPLTAEKARALLLDPSWASKALSDHARRS